MQYLSNPYRGQGMLPNTPDARVDATGVSRLLANCPVHSETPLINASDLASICGVASIHLKDERTRMGLGSFKALGAAHAIAKDASKSDVTQRTYVAATAGNHGLSVAAGATVFGARAIIYLAAPVPEAFAERLRAKGAKVVRAGENYEESMTAAKAAAGKNAWTLLSDSTWDGYLAPALDVMEGYLQLAAEAVRQIPNAPTHILLQAGVGGMAAAVAAYARKAWGDAPAIIVVEPDAAPALFESIRAGSLVTTQGPVSAMGRLDCKTPSLVGLATLSRDANAFVTISEDEALHATQTLTAQGYASTPSGTAGIAALMSGLAFLTDARVLAILSEGPEG